MDAQQRGGQRHGAAVVAGGVGHHSPGPFARVEQAEAVVGAAELERPATLERLGLEADPGAATRVQGGRGEQGSAVGDAGQPDGGGLDPLEGES